jgi:hypothetical protein
MRRPRSRLQVAPHEHPSARSSQDGFGKDILAALEGTAIGLAVAVVLIAVWVAIQIF